MTPEPDYPAAHSMDTEWYAVDRDGHIALFNSGEAGALPSNAHTEHETAREDLAKVLPVAPFRLLDWLGDDLEEQHRELPNRRSKTGLGPTLLFLNNLELISKEIEKHGVEQAPASEGVAVFFRDLSSETAWRIHEAGACFGCFPWPSKVDGYGYDLHNELPNQMGLFRYDHETENWIAGSYGREETPTRPLKLDELPPELQEKIGQVRFENLSFAETEKIQPIDHVDCQAWGDAYLDLDGRTVRPIPGREADFDAAAWSHDPRLRVIAPRQDPPV